MSMGFPKKALVTSNTHLTDTDGKSLRVISLAQLLKSAGFSVTLVVSKCSSAKAAKFSVVETKTQLRNTLLDTFPEKVLFFGRQSLRLLAFYLKLLVQGASYDIVVSTLVGPEIDSLFACIFSKIKKAHFIYDYDDPSPEIRMLLYKRKNDPRVKLSLFSREMLVRGASLVFTAANTTRQQIMEQSKKTKRVYVWYNLPITEDMHIDENKEQLRRKLGLNQKTFIVSYLGNIPNWGIGIIINLLTNCTKKLKNEEQVIFTIIGGGQWQQPFRELLRRLDLDNHVQITGRQSRRSALEHLVASDLSLFPFGFNLVSIYIVPTKLFEAMALGTPVICPRLPDFVRILGDDGIYFENSIDDLVEKIRWCIRNPERLGRISLNLKSRFLREYAQEKRSLYMGNILKAVSIGSSSSDQKAGLKSETC